MSDHRDLYVIVRASDGTPLWSAVCHKDQADDAAVAYALQNVSGGVNLLNGVDLAQHLSRRAEEEEPVDEEEEDPCCVLYRQPYLADHEYGCPARVRAEGRTYTPPKDN